MNWSVSPLMLWVLLIIMAGPPLVYLGMLAVDWIERRYGPDADHPRRLS